MKKRDFNPAFYDALDRIEGAKRHWELATGEWEKAFWSESALSAFETVTNNFVGWAVNYRVDKAQNEKVPSMMGRLTPAIRGQHEADLAQSDGEAQRRILIALLGANPLSLPWELNQQIVASLEAADHDIRSGLMLLDRDTSNKKERERNENKQRRIEELFLRLSAIGHVQYRTRKSNNTEALMEVASAFCLGGLSPEGDGSGTIAKWAERLDGFLGEGTVSRVKKSANHSWKMVQAHLEDGNIESAEISALPYSNDALARDATRYKEIMKISS